MRFHDLRIATTYGPSLMASVPRSPAFAPPLVDSLRICAWPDFYDLIRPSALSRTKPHDEVYDRLLCQITETEPKTAMAGPARSIARRTRRNKPTSYHRSGNRWTLFCDNSPGGRDSFSQLYFRRRFTGGAMNQILEVTGSRLWDGPTWSPPRRGCCRRRTRGTSHNESQDL